MKRLKDFINESLILEKKPDGVHADIIKYYEQLKTLSDETHFRVSGSGKSSDITIKKSYDSNGNKPGSVHIEIIFTLEYNARGLKLTTPVISLERHCEEGEEKSYIVFNRKGNFCFKKMFKDGLDWLGNNWEPFGTIKKTPNIFGTFFQTEHKNFLIDPACYDEFFEKLSSYSSVFDSIADKLLKQKELQDEEFWVINNHKDYQKQYDFMKKTIGGIWSKFLQ